MRSVWEYFVLIFCTLWGTSSIIMILFHHYPYEPEEHIKIWGHIKSPREFYKIRRLANIMKLTPLSMYMLFEFLCTQYNKPRGGKE